MDEFEYAVRVVKDGEEYILPIDAGGEAESQVLAESFANGNKGKYESKEFDHYEVVFRRATPWESY